MPVPIDPLRRSPSATDLVAARAMPPREHGR